MNGYEYKPKEKSRVQQINDNLLQSIKSIYRLRKIQRDIVDNKPRYAYVISLAKSYPLSLEEQVLSVYNRLKSILFSDEILVAENKCFKIISDLYEVEFCIEAWRKSADKIAYIQNGEVVIELLHRMSCEKAAYIFKKQRVEPFELLNTLKTLQKYKHPADKYCALAKMPILLEETHTRGELNEKLAE